MPAPASSTAKGDPGKGTAVSAPAPLATTEDDEPVVTPTGILIPPKYGSADPMGPEPKNPGEGSLMYGTMFKFQYDPANLGAITVNTYKDTAERNSDPRIARAPNGTMIVTGTVPQVKIAGAWYNVTATT